MQGFHFAWFCEVTYWLPDFKEEAGLPDTRKAPSLHATKAYGEMEA
jgi:hypothetical protein